MLDNGHGEAPPWGLWGAAPVFGRGLLLPFPGPIRILNVLIGLLLSRHHVDLLAGLCSIPHNIPD